MADVYEDYERRWFELELIEHKKKFYCSKVSVDGISMGFTIFCWMWQQYYYMKEEFGKLYNLLGRY